MQGHEVRVSSELLNTVAGTELDEVELAGKLQNGWFLHQVHAEDGVLTSVNGHVAAVALLPSTPSSKVLPSSSAGGSRGHSQHVGSQDKVASPVTTGQASQSHGIG